MDLIGGIGMDPIKLIQSITDESMNEKMEPLELIWNCSNILKWFADGGFIEPFNSRELARIVSLALCNSVQKLEDNE
jgi:hypothetical protein